MMGSPGLLLLLLLLLSASPAVRHTTRDLIFALDAGTIFERAACCCRQRTAAALLCHRCCNMMA
jgi:hypothetical protein